MIFTGNVVQKPTSAPPAERSAVASRKPAATVGSLPKPRSRRSRQLVSESKLSYLKVLTRALLRRIEELHNSSESDERFDLKTEVQKFEAELIRSALAMTRGRQRAAARVLGTKSTTLHTKIRRYKIAVDAPHEDTETR